MELFLYTAGFLTLLSSGVLLLAGAARGESGADPTFLALLGVSVVLLMMGCLPWEWGIWTSCHRLEGFCNFFDSWPADCLECARWLACRAF